MTEPATASGKAGIEAAYDSYLRGRSRARADPRRLARPTGGPYVPRQESTPGYALRLTLDMKLQRAAEQALQYGIGLAHENDQWAANGGAIVALDPRTAPAPRWRRPDLQAVGLRRPNRPEEARRPLLRHRQPALQPCDRRPLPAGVDLEAGNGARRHGGARLLRVRLLQCTGSATYGLDKQGSGTGTRTSTGR